MSELLNNDYPLCCPKCGGNEVYFENPATGSGKYTCQNCEFMGDEDEFNRIITPDELKQLQQQLSDRDDTIASLNCQLSAALTEVQQAYGCYENATHMLGKALKKRDGS